MHGVDAGHEEQCAAVCHRAANMHVWHRRTASDLSLSRSHQTCTSGGGGRPFVLAQRADLRPGGGDGSMARSHARLGRSLAARRQEGCGGQTCVVFTMRVREGYVAARQPLVSRMRCGAGTSGRRGLQCGEAQQALGPHCSKAEQLASLAIAIRQGGPLARVP